MTRANVGTVAAHSSSTPLLRLGLKPSSHEFYNSSNLRVLSWVVLSLRARSDGMTDGSNSALAAEDGVAVNE